MTPATARRRTIADLPRSPTRRGVSLVEVIVATLAVSLLLLVLLAILPRQRENARTNSCRRSLAQIGVALALYDRSEGHLPTVPGLADPPTPAHSPLASLLATLALPDFTELDPDKPPPRPQPGSVSGERRVLGFVCPSDPNAALGTLPAPTSYRATTGDSSRARNGGFAPGRRLRLLEIEEGDGRSYTAAFSERLLGDGRDGQRSVGNYAKVSSPLRDAGCSPGAGDRWVGDAGSSWARVGWAFTLYHHGLLPNAAPSCVAGDGLSGEIGASSGHVSGVNVLMFDGGVRMVTPTIAPPVWQAMATTHIGPAAPTVGKGRGADTETGQERTGR